MKYVLQYIDDRYDGIAAIGYWSWDNAIEMDGSEPFSMEDFQNWRWDKNIQAWVAGLIKKNGNWVRGDSIEGQLLDKWRKLKNRLGIVEKE